MRFKRHAQNRQTLELIDNTNANQTSKQIKEHLRGAKPTWESIYIDSKGVLRSNDELNTAWLQMPILELEKWQETPFKYSKQFTNDAFITNKKEETTS